MLPYFAGERTPLFDPDARGVVAGLTLRHTRGDIYRAGLEATAYGVWHNLVVLREVHRDWLCRNGLTVWWQVGQAPAQVARRYCSLRMVV